ncbi:hypothetical protein SDC9_176760 [bioreactor metagenome]|uniref:Uncharacterized protein n=1 Tax=bioreactor metagenome TaxID=1076179 RepID=A0A645GQZ0_9ZZZZ
MGVFLDLRHDIGAVFTDKADGFPGGAGAAGPSDAVHIVFGMVRKIVVDNMGDSGNMDSARGHIGGDHHFDIAGLEALQNIDPLGLGNVPGKQFRLNAVFI